MASARRTGEWSPGRPDYALLAITALLTGIGIVAVWSSSFVIGLVRFDDPYYYVVRQLIWAVLGGVFMFTAMKMDYRRLQPLALPIMVITLVVLAAVILMGQTGGGARRWLAIGPLAVQPAEFAKLAVIIYVAAWLSSKGEAVRSMRYGLLPFVVIVGLVGLFIMMQPSLGTTLVILVVTVTMFWVGGATILQMAALTALGGGAVGAMAVLEGYRLDRLAAFFNAEGDPLGNGFQTLQALIALGNGGIGGLGLGASRGKFFYVPESHTDGVFAIIGEELGIIATVSIIALFVIFMARGYLVATRARDPFGFYVATGITTWVIAQALLNAGGITRVIPLTGVPLPFLSSGGSALAAIMLAIGVLLSISRHGKDRGGYLDGRPQLSRREIIKKRRES